MILDQLRLWRRPAYARAAGQDPIVAARIGQVIWLLFCIGLCVLVAVFTWIPEYLILFCVGKGGWL